MPTTFEEKKNPLTAYGNLSRDRDYSGAQGHYNEGVTAMTEPGLIEAIDRAVEKHFHHDRHENRDLVSRCEDAALPSASEAASAVKGLITPQGNTQQKRSQGDLQFSFLETKLIDDFQCQNTSTSCFSTAVNQSDDSNRDSLSIQEFEFWSLKYIHHLQYESDGSMITARDRLGLTRRLLCFLREKQYDRCGPQELNEYFYFLRNKHKSEESALSPVSIASYYRNLKPIFSWFVEQNALAQNPLLKIKRPKDNSPQKEPLSQESVDALIAACALSNNPERDEALILFMLDTGCRNSEISSLSLKNVNLKGGFAKVIGKGNKKRQVHFTSYTTEKIQIYLDKVGRKKGDNGILFRNRYGSAFGKDGLCDVVKRLAAKAGLSDDATVHAFRRTFAVEMLRNDAHVYAVQRALGHTDLKTTLIYSKIAQSDIERQHRLASPVNRFMKNQVDQSPPAAGNTSPQEEVLTAKIPSARATADALSPTPLELSVPF